MATPHNWMSLALSKLTKTYDKELLLDLSADYFDGVYAPIFKIVQQHFSDTQKIPSIETLEALVTSKAPKAQLPVVLGVITAIKSVKASEIASGDIVKGLKDKQLLIAMDLQISSLTQAAMAKDTEGVRQILNEVVEEVNISRAKPTDFMEAMEAEDTSKIVTTGIEGLDQHLTGMAGLTIVSGASGCVDEQTEFMTPTGWKKISEYEEGDLVLGWDEDGTSEFVVPETYINKPADTFYHLNHAFGMDQMLSPEHKVPYITSKGNLQTKSMEEVYTQHINSKEGFKGKFITNFSASGGKGVWYTDTELRLMVAISADGYIDPRGRLQVTFRLKKEAKKDRLCELLQDSNISYSRNDAVSSEGYSVIAFKPPKLTKDLTELYQATIHQLHIINDEVVHWDGSIDKRGGNRRFYTTIKEHADFIQFVMTTCTNTRVSINTQDRVGQEYKTGGTTYVRKSKEYVVCSTSSKTLGISSNKVKPTQSIKKYDSKGARKYCFTMPTGYWVMRRNDNIVVTGNCGKSAFLLEAAIGQFKAGHSILFVSLELSAQVLGKRLKASLTGIPFGKIIKDDLSKDERVLIAETMREFFSDPNKSFRVVTTPLDSEELLNLIKVEKSLYDIDIAYIDYLNLVGAPKGSEDGWKNLSNTAKALHRLSMEIGVVSVSASQTDLEKAPKGGAYPVIRTRGSAELLFSATLLIYLYKPDGVEGDDGDNSIILYVLKNRNAGQCQLLMNADFTYMKYEYIMEI